jgi:uncharacterized protein YodC (DUF2158 family)
MAEKLPFDAYPTGSIVHLKSGSPPLTLVCYRGTTVYGDDVIVAEVEWFDGAECRRDSFLAQCMTNDPAANTMAMAKAAPPDLTSKAG